MDFKFVFIWTDVLVYMLFFAGVSYAVYCSLFEHLCTPWRQVAQNKMAMAAAFILSWYLIIGLCDSVHLQFVALDEAKNIITDNDGNKQYDPEVFSALDILILPLKENTEKTFSSPLALYSFSKENVTLPDGKQIRSFPKLKHAGSHLLDENKKVSDIFWKTLTGGGVAALITVIFFGIISYKKSSLPLSLFAFSLTVMFCIGASLNVGHYYHLFGTDKVGLDVFYRAIKGIRTGIVIGTLTTLVMLPFAIMMGTMAGYFKGYVDDIIQYIYITISSIPGILLIAATVKILDVYMDTHPEQFGNITIKADTRLLFLCFILGLSGWAGLCRVLRGETLKLREMEYVQAATALGVSNIRIIIKHIVPNIMHIVLITVVLKFSGLVLAEAVLSYVGIGVDPSMESWGNMINAARLELARDPVVWWNLAAAFVLMFGLVLAANLFADAVRDAFDPRLRTK